MSNSHTRIVIRSKKYGYVLALQHRNANFLFGIKAACVVAI